MKPAQMIATTRRWLRILTTIQVSDRQAFLMAVLSGALLITLTVIWLSLTTRTALLNQQIDALDAQLASLIDETNQTWAEIGKVTKITIIEDRARQLGFRPAERVEYLISDAEGARR
jgi:cell division protein FtsB